MFWRFGAYANISTIDTILEKPDFTLEDLLDEGDLIQELKQHNAKLVEYLREPEVLQKLLQYVVTPKLEPVAAPDDDDQEEDEAKGKGISLPFSRPRASSRATDNGKEEEGERKRNRYAFVAAEVLSSDNWSIYEALMESRPFLRTFWQFLKRPIPLDPLQASYFTKVNESLFDKKTEEMLELLKSLEDAVPDMLKHVDSPMIMDLLLKIISLERTESGQGIIEWLYTQDVMPTLLSFLGPEHSWATQTSAGDFMKAIITVSANASQNEQTCIGPNELTRQLVSQPCVEQLIKYMLGGGNPLTVGVGIIIEVIRKNNSDYDPDVVAEPDSTPSSRDPIYLGTLLRLFAQHVPDFMNLIMNAPAQKERLDSTFGEKIEPLGFDRFKTCELMAELLHCSNMALLNEVGSEELIAARDVERQRLRKEGKLAGFQGEEIPPPGDDLTMRISQSSAPDEGRKLEVTNSSADDDGFEEVTHGGDEDTSHEFVRAEEDIPDLPDVPATSFLDRDDDDFVDEPLSSPRLNVRDVDAKDEEPGFEDPELMVAPLSPTKPLSPKKPKSIETGESSASEAENKTEGSVVKATGATAGDEPAYHPDHKAPEGPVVGDQSDTTAMATPVISEPENSGPEEARTGTSEGPSPLPEGLSPHAEDTPAPLFSDQSSAIAPGSEDGKATQRPAEEKEPKDKETDVAEQEPGEASIIVGRPAEPSTAAKETPPNPVVGDYLKMQFVEYRVVPTILSFFFKYPWNNFLHNVVYDVVQQVFNGPMDRGYNPTVVISLFEAADVTSQIINGQTASEMSQAKNKTRMGYMGHLTLIAEELVKFTERHPPELLSETILDRVMSQDWINYVEGALAETRERDNAILGGVRPEVAMSNRAGASGLSGTGLSSIGLSLGGGGGGGVGGNSQAGSSALADAGLNGSLDLSGNGGNGIGPFAISAGTLMSGFGSSSDEEEDEEQESEEDVNNEFRAYTDPLNANQSSSLIPPSIPPPPPPPPPLNIPPSRARRQLAARLAMNKRNAAAAAAAGEEEGEHGGNANGAGSDGEQADHDDDEDAGFSVLKGSQAASELTSSTGATPWELRDPFADDDDDDAGGDGSGSDDGRDDGDVGSRSSAWNRGGWWRGVVRTAKRGGAKRRSGDVSRGTLERFGDGRDDSDESDEEREVDDDDVDDEEFGDFAMPEADAGRGARHDAGTITGIDPAREKVLLKPLPVHPASNKSGGSPFGSLWPFSTQAFGAGSKDKGREEEDEEEEVAGANDDGKRAVGEEPDVVPEISAEPLELGPDETVVGEDGKKIDRAVEAKRRTSIEDPDEDDIGLKEVVVGRGG